MQAVGLNRFFGDVLTNEGLDYRMLPTLTFIVSVLIAFATGTSWGVSTRQCHNFAKGSITNEESRQ